MKVKKIYLLKSNNKLKLGSKLLANYYRRLFRSAKIIIHPFRIEIKRPDVMMIYKENLMKCSIN
jgi:hypothetical protein